MVKLSAPQKNLCRVAAICFLAAGLVLLTLSTVAYRAANAGAGDNLTGYAWSSNIGWISFNNTNTGGAQDYGVRVDAAGNLSGYAWSPNVGWVSFNSADVSGCPGTPGNMTCQPKINSVSKQVSGWARVVSGVGRTDGWDGWMSLRGVSPDYGVAASGPSPCTWSGFAWGSEVLGWISFRGTAGGGSIYGVSGTGLACGAAPLVVSANAAPNPQNVNLPVTWSAFVSGGVPPYGYSWSGTDGLSGASSSVNKSYTTIGVKNGTVTVTDSAAQSESASASVTINPAGSPPGFREVIPE